MTSPQTARKDPSGMPLVGTALATGDAEQAAHRAAARAVEEADRIGLGGRHGAALRAEAALSPHHGGNRACPHLA
ncbi:hypothetical protein [Streptomyces griseorubiginosus]|uniref:hypothetical protein n=1 Tax=Streptomyces griseorubiginosus TaxID=67304 RepID=UPI0033C3B600